jgi:hypothetical protein
MNGILKYLAQQFENFPMNIEKEEQLFVDAYNKAVNLQSYNEFEKAYKLLVPLVEERGKAIHQHILGVMYDEGLGVSKSFTKAFKWWKLSAEQGCADAQADLGAMCLVKKWVFFGDNKKEAIKWFRLSAEQGHDRGQMGLGISYLDGEGVSKDYKEATKWFRLAAEQGNARGLFFLGNMYELGRGVPVNFNEAVKWYRLASLKFTGTPRPNSYMFPKKNNPRAFPCSAASRNHLVASL